MTGGCLCGAVRWTHARLFRSSPIARRAHCGLCGAPLSLKYDSRSDTAVTGGSLDEPQAVPLTHHYGVEGRLPWADIGRHLPGRETREKW